MLELMLLTAMLSLRQTAGPVAVHVADADVAPATEPAPLPSAAPAPSAEPKVSPSPKATAEAPPTTELKATTEPKAPPKLTTMPESSGNHESPPAKPPIKLTALNHGKTIVAAVGEKIIVTLSGNATTGFAWSLAKLDGQSVKQTGKAEYVPDDAKGKVGVGGKYTFTFEAAKAGKTALNFEYKKPWEKTVDSVVNITIDVKE